MPQNIKRKAKNKMVWRNEVEAMEQELLNEVCLILIKLKKNDWHRRNGETAIIVITAYGVNYSLSLVVVENKIAVQSLLFLFLCVWTPIFSTPRA